MTEINGHIYKAALLRLEDQMKERAAKIEKLRKERDDALAENERLQGELDKSLERERTRRCSHD